jgi:hypothetical protein
MRLSLMKSWNSAPRAWAAFWQALILVRNIWKYSITCEMRV